MISLLISVLLAWTPFAQEGKDIPFDVRARQNLLMGKGSNSGSPYYDVIITRQPTQGILIKLPYTKKGGKFSFDLHHRIAMTEDFGLPAEVTTVVEVLSGGRPVLGYTRLPTRSIPETNSTSRSSKPAPPKSINTSLPSLARQLRWISAPVLSPSALLARCSSLREERQQRASIRLERESPPSRTSSSRRHRRVFR